MNEHKNILVMIDMDEAHKKALAEAAPQAHFIFADNDDNLPSAEMMAEVNIIIGNPRRRLLSYAKKLEWMQLQSAGANLYTEPGMLPENCVLTNATGCFGLAISEYMIGMVLNLFQKFPAYHDNQKNHVWRNEGAVKSIYDSTALVIGMGDIGSEFSSRFRAMGGHVIGVRRSAHNKPDYVDELYPMEQIDALLPRADVVTLSLPETPLTKKMFGKERLSLMKQDAILLNVGRGSAIDTDALCDALNSGHLGGAAIDVTDPEPLPADHPAWNAKNLLITPHISGGYNLRQTRDSVFSVCKENLSNYMAGAPLKNMVDLSTGYKKTEA